MFVLRKGTWAGKSDYSSAVCTQKSGVSLGMVHFEQSRASETLSR